MTDHVVDASGLLAVFVSTSKAETPRRADDAAPVWNETECHVRSSGWECGWRAPRPTTTAHTEPPSSVLLTATRLSERV